MSTIDPKILNKIKKCLALSGSPNPHEAAVAMRQAHALMRQHGVEAHHVSMSEIGEATTQSRTMSRDKMANWEARLASIVGSAFGCKMLVSRVMYPKEFRTHANDGHFIFIGQKAQAEVAAYTVSVLSRKCKTARQKWIAENLAGLSARGGKAQVTRMGDAFAEGWVNSIGKLVADFANPPEIDAAIERHIAEKDVGKGETSTRRIKSDKIGRGEMLAAQMGAQAAKGESIYRPMNGAQPQAALGMEGIAS